MNEIMSSPYLSIVLCVAFFELGLLINRKARTPLFNPLFIAITGVIIFLKLSSTDYAQFSKGGNVISLFLAPATVVLAMPMYRQLDKLKANIIPILAGTAAGSLCSMGSVYILSKLMGLNDELTLSLIPKSVTTPIGMEISRQLGGIPSLTVAAIVLTGIIGAILAPSLCRLFQVKDSISAGIAIGTSSHAVGTTKALEMGETEGAMSGLAIGMAGILTALFSLLL